MVKKHTVVVRIAEGLPGNSVLALPIQAFTSSWTRTDRVEVQQDFRRRWFPVVSVVATKSINLNVPIGPQRAHSPSGILDFNGMRRGHGWFSSECFAELEDDDERNVG